MFSYSFRHSTKLVYVIWLTTITQSDHSQPYYASNFKNYLKSEGCKNGSGKQSAEISVNTLQYRALPYITIPTNIAAVDTSTSRACSYLCRDGYVGMCMVL